MDSPPPLQGRGIIPARAGFTCSSSRRLLNPRDHPRSRGVYHFRPPSRRGSAGSSPLARGLRTALHDVLLLGQGSSPLARGLRRYTIVVGAMRGIIPARAGFTPGRSRTSGSATRIIPARAGFTPACGCRARSARDHPRSRGVYVIVAVWRAILGGSSPLARGLPRHDWAAAATARIIPARAGFTPPRTTRTTW